MKLCFKHAKRNRCFVMSYLIILQKVTVAVQGGCISTGDRVTFEEKKTDGAAGPLVSNLVVQRLAQP